MVSFEGGVRLFLYFMVVDWDGVFEREFVNFLGIGVVSFNMLF